MEENDIEILVRNGFTERMARTWLAECQAERESGLFDEDELTEAHGNGFLATHLSAYDTKGHPLSSYMTDYDYYRLWPFNPWQRIWINDKLTLKYMLDGTRFGGAMPEYYYYTDSRCRLLPLLNLDKTEGFLAMLERRGAIACKPCNGSCSEGFFKLEACGGGGYLINGEPCSSDGIGWFLGSHPNYVFTEYLVPHRLLHRIHPLIHTLRLVMVNPTEGDPFIAGGFLRFGVDSLASRTGANYSTLSNGSDRWIVAGVDFGSGRFGGARAVQARGSESCPVHPDSGETIMGTIPGWSRVLDLVFGVAERFSALRVMGFDIGVTEDGPKIMEINSHPGIHAPQVISPLLENQRFSSFLEECDWEISELNRDARELRAALKR